MRSDGAVWSRRRSRGPDRGLVFRHPSLPQVGVLVPVRARRSCRPSTPVSGVVPTGWGVCERKVQRSFLKNNVLKMFIHDPTDGRAPDTGRGHVWV